MGSKDMGHKEKKKAKKDSKKILRLIWKLLPHPLKSSAGARKINSKKNSVLNSKSEYRNTKQFTKYSKTDK